MHCAPGGLAELSDALFCSLSLSLFLFLSFSLSFSLSLALSVLLLSVLSPTQQAFLCHVVGGVYNLISPAGREQVRQNSLFPTRSL